MTKYEIMLLIGHYDYLAAYWIMLHQLKSLYDADLWISQSKEINIS